MNYEFRDREVRKEECVPLHCYDLFILSTTELICMTSFETLQTYHFLSFLLNVILL